MRSEAKWLACLASIYITGCATHQGTVPPPNTQGAQAQATSLECIPFRNVITSGPRKPFCDNVPSLNSPPLSKGEVLAQLHSHDVFFQGIYRRFLRDDPTIEGSLTINLKISSGKVSSAEIDPSSTVPLNLAQKIIVSMNFVFFRETNTPWQGSYTLHFSPKSL